MPDLFDPLSEQEIRAALRRQKQQAKARQQEEFDLAVDYLEGRMVEDIRGELDRRYANRQSGPANEEIEPVVIPLTERFVAEQANAYNKHVSRDLVTLDGEENDATRNATSQLQRELDSAGHDESQHLLEKITVLLNTCCLWYQAKRGSLRSRVVVPQRVYPVLPEDRIQCDASDPDDYAGFVVELNTDTEDINSTDPTSFVFITPAEHVYYSGRQWDEPTGEMVAFKNPMMWPQVVETEDRRGASMDLPLRMLTFWHTRLPLDELIIDTDPEIVYLNREINLQLSVLMDTLRVQGHSQLWMQLLNPDAPPPRVSYGSMFAIPLGAGESMGYASAANSYSDMVEALKFVVKLMAIAKRQSPNDFATEGTGPESGFAKLVSSLPKLEAREERLKRLRYMEEVRSWPRIGSILRYLGKIDFDPTQLKLRVGFADVEFPKTVDEETKRDEHDFKHGLRTPADVLSDKLGISTEEAQEKIDENKQRAPQQQPEGGGFRPMFGQRIGRPGI